MVSKSKEETRIPGIFLKEDISHVQQSKGPEGVTLLKEKMKEIINIDEISAIKSYPLTIETKLIEAGCDVLFGSHGSESWKKWGYHDMITAQKSSLGKIAFSLSKDPTGIVKQGKSLLAFFNPYVVYDYKIESDKKIILIVGNNPYPPYYFQGAYQAYLDYYQLKNTKIEIQRIGEKDYYIATWD